MIRNIKTPNQAQHPTTAKEHVFTVIPNKSQATQKKKKAKGKKGGSLLLAHLLIAVDCLLSGTDERER